MKLHKKTCLPGGGGNLELEKFGEDKFGGGKIWRVFLKTARKNLAGFLKNGPEKFGGLFLEIVHFPIKPARSAENFEKLLSKWPKMAQNCMFSTYFS